jgi:hypothetical protein
VYQRVPLGGGQSIPFAIMLKDTTKFNNLLQQL